MRYHDLIAKKEQDAPTEHAMYEDNLYFSWEIKNGETMFMKNGRVGLGKFWHCGKGMRMMGPNRPRKTSRVTKCELCLLVFSSFNPT